jgi:hypothetical protein
MRSMNIMSSSRSAFFELVQVMKWLLNAFFTISLSWPGYIDLIF